MTFHVLGRYLRLRKRGGGSGASQKTGSVCGSLPLPPPRFRNRKYLPKTWNVLARTAWLYGHSLDGESNRDARKRALQAAERLHEASADGKVPPLPGLRLKAAESGVPRSVTVPQRAALFIRMPR